LLELARCPGGVLRCAAANREFGHGV
jgi:hypothetical protein